MTISALSTKIQVCYPQALTKLLYRFNDIVLAEDLLHEAIVKALSHWQENMPDNGVAWLVRVALNHFIDRTRRDNRLINCFTEIEPSYDVDLTEQALLDSYKDDLLRLIFTCCHPALNLKTQLVLTLKHVLGLSIVEISNALVQKEKTIEQRLTRAKVKISKANIPYQIPEIDEWPKRTDAVLQVIYLYFNEGYFTSCDNQLVNRRVCKNAIRLARILHSCIRENPEIMGLLALLLHQNARLSARVDHKQKLVLLEQQNRDLWYRPDINEANILVEKSLKIGGGTPYAIQAAIAALHNNAISFEQTDWQQMYGLYLKLLKLNDSPVIQLNAEVVRAKFTNNFEAIDRIEKLAETLKGYRHLYTTLAALHLKESNFASARFYYLNALKFTQNSTEKRFVSEQLRQC